MNCSESRPLLQIYLDNELSPVDARCVEDHLNACDPCAGELNAFRRIDGLLSNAVDRDASASGPFGDCMRETYSAPVPRHWSRWGRLAVAASLILGITPFAMMAVHNRASKMLLRAAVDEHERAEMSGAGALAAGSELDALVARFTSSPVSASAVEGMRLVGGHPCHVGDVRCAHLVFATSDGRVISVYLSREPVETDTLATLTEVDGELVADSGDRTGRRIVVGDLESREAVLRARETFR